jgi:hypothetical protein
VEKQGNVSTYNPKVDILFIVDDSGSMGKFQDRLAANADLFIDQFLKARFIDYHIGVTSSTERSTFWGSKASAGKLHETLGVRYVDRETKDPEFVLKGLLDLGEGGDATERFLSIPRLALSEFNLNNHNRGFYREDAHLVIFMLTDTYDQTHLRAETTFDFLLKLKNGNRNLLHYAASIVTIEKTDCQSESDVNLPVKLTRLAELFGQRGYRFNICQSDYGKDLARVATGIVDAVSTLYLEDLPDVTTLQVLYGDKLIPNQEVGGWTYDFTLNAIHLSPEIDVVGANGDNVSVRYEPIYKEPEEE